MTCRRGSLMQRVVPGDSKQTNGAMMRRWIALVPLILGVGLISVLLDDKISSHEYPDFQCNVNLLCCISWVVVAGLIWRGLAIRRAAALMLASLAVTSLITASTY